MANNGRPFTEARTNEGGTSLTLANSTPTSPRHQGGAKQASTFRDNLELYRFSKIGEPLGQNDTRSLGKLSYMEINKLLDRKIVQNNKGTLTELERHKLVKEWQDQRA
jgi:hypothetical protein